MNLGPVLRLLSALICLVAVVVLAVSDTTSVDWLFGGLYAALGLYVAATVVGEFPTRRP